LHVEVASPAVMKFRPIVAGSACPTSRLSQLIDDIIILNQFLNIQKSNVRDDVDFLTKYQFQLDKTHKYKLATISNMKTSALILAMI
jgi:hypothetical protein